MNNKKWTFYFELAARCHVFILLNLYGWGKLLGGQFYRQGSLPPEVAHQTLSEAGSFDLAWTFFGHSFGYILFIGLTQIVGAWLLLWEKTTLLGVAVLIPILVNIVAVDAFFDVSFAIISALVYLVLLGLVLFFNRSKLLAALEILTKPGSTETRPWPVRIKTVGISLGIFALTFGMEQLLLSLAGHH